MSSVAIAFNQLPSEIQEHLHPIGEFYIYSSFKEDIVKPPRIQIGENIYFRFMNYLYLPQPPESLSPEKSNRDL